MYFCTCHYETSNVCHMRRHKNSCRNIPGQSQSHRILDDDDYESKANSSVIDLKK